VADIADTTTARRASSKDANAHAPGAGGALTPLAGVSAGQWRALSTRAAEPNGYYLPEWELAVNASARGRGDTDALGAWRDASSLIGLVPVISMWRAYKIPLPALVSADPYGTLCTPLLDRDMAAEAVTGRRPFRGRTHGELLTAIMNEPFTLGGDGPEVRRLESVLQRAVAVDAAARYPSAAALARELLPALRDLPSIAPASGTDHEPTVA